MTQPATMTPPPDQTSSKRSFGERLVAALRLDASLYEEVEHDPDALGQAAGVVALAGVASALGALGSVGASGILAGLVLSFVAWLIWAGIVWLIGVKLFSHTSDFGELLRTLGFVAAPQMLYAIGILPWTWLHAVIALAVSVMTVVAFVRCVRQALDVDTGRALFVSLLSFVAYLLLAGLLGAATLSA
jgi:hypothetical protein